MRVCADPNCEACRGVARKLEPVAEQLRREETRQQRRQREREERKDRQRVERRIYGRTRR